MDLKQRITRELRKNSEGLTISELAKKAKTTRNTVAIALAFLEGAKQVKIRQVGMAKLYFLK